MDDDADESTTITFRQKIFFNGRNNLSITTNSFYSKSVPVFDGKFGKMLKLPIDSWFSLQCDLLDSFITKHCNIPERLLSSWKPTNIVPTPYKPIINHCHNLIVKFSPWCKLFIDDKEVDLFDSVHKLGEGSYQIEIISPFVFYGAHKSSHLCSLTLRVSKVFFQPTVSSTND